MAKTAGTSHAKGALTTLGAVLLASCIVQQPPPQQAQPLANNHDESGQPVAVQKHTGVPPEGDYACRFKVQRYEYPAFPCRVYRRQDGTLMLEKLAGSQRIRGEIQPMDTRRFRFEGTFYCPWGDCTERVSMQFDTVDNGLYRAPMQMQSGTTWVTLDYLPEGFAYGGATYGGATYGGATYGGATYGGATYGGATYGGATYGGAYKTRR